MDQLVNRVKNGDQSAYRELYHKFSVPMYNVCLRITNNADESNDVLQDVFVKIFQNIKSLENAQLLPAWIKKITVNTALQTIQKNKKLQIDENIDPISISEIEIQNEESILDLETEHELLISKIQEAIKMLPERYRIVFTLHVLEEYSHEEISKMLGIVSSTSRSQYLRAKIKLIEILKKIKVMSDQLKAFIQQHKSEFDDKRPDPNLFDKIISEMDANSHNNSRKIIFLPIYKKMIAAASIALILCSAVFLYLKKDQNKTDRNTLVVEQLPTVNRDDVNVESITVTPSIIQEKQVPFIKKFKKSINTSKYNSSSQPIPYGLSSIEQKIIVQTPALTTVSAPINNTESISLNKPKDFNTPIENKPNISNSNNKLESQIPTKEIANIDNSELSKSTENISTNYSSDATNQTSSNLSIKQYLRAKFYSMVSRKASKWTNKALQIKATESEDETNLAIQFKSDKLNFNKSISFPILEQ